MATYPIEEQIAQKVVTALETVDGTGDFQTTVSEVKRLAKSGVGWILKDNQCILEMGDPSRFEGNAFQGNRERIGWRQPYMIYCVARPGDDDQEPIDQRLAIFRADVTVAMMDDIQWGDLATNTEVSDPTYLRAPDGSYEGFLLVFDVFYRVADNDPYTAV